MIKSCDSPENGSCHRVPANPERATTWLQAIQANNAGASLRICGRHFHESCFKISRKRIHSGAAVKKELKLSAIPTLHLQNVSLGEDQENLKWKTTITAYFLK